jgi:hypothetical protein
MADRSRKRVSISPPKRQKSCRGVEPWPSAGEALIALTRAWVVATIATALLVAALAIAPVWDRAIFTQALRDALSTGPEMAQPADSAPAGSRQASVILTQALIDGRSNNAQSYRFTNSKRTILGGE